MWFFIRFLGKNYHIVLFLDDYFFCHDAFLSDGDEEINAFGVSLHVILHYLGAAITVCGELVDEVPHDVVHFQVDSTSELLESEGHLPVVWVGHYAEIGRAFLLFFDAVVGTHKPIAKQYALRRASVVYSGIEPNGIFHVVKDIDSASLTRRMGG